MVSHVTFKRGTPGGSDQRLHYLTSSPLHLLSLTHLALTDGAGYADDGEEILGIHEDHMDAKKRALAEVDNSDNKLAKKARQLADAGRAQKGAIMNFARTGVTEAKRKAVVIKEAPKEHELDIDMIMDDTPMQVGARRAAITSSTSQASCLHLAHSSLGARGLRPSALFPITAVCHCAS